MKAPKVIWAGNNKVGSNEGGLKLILFSKTGLIKVYKYHKFVQGQKNLQRPDF